MPLTLKLSFYMYNRFFFLNFKGEFYKVKLSTKKLSSEIQLNFGHLKIAYELENEVPLIVLASGFTHKKLSSGLFCITLVP